MFIANLDSPQIRGQILTLLTEDEDLPTFISAGIFYFTYEHEGNPPKYILLGRREMRLVKAMRRGAEELMMVYEEAKPDKNMPTRLVTEPGMRVTFRGITLLEVTKESFLDFVI